MRSIGDVFMDTTIGTMHVNTGFGTSGSVTTYDGTTWQTTMPGPSEFEKIEKRLESIETRLSILVEDNELLEANENFPALKEAYEHYKMIEALCKGHKKDE